jgi:hypothetical protein
MDRQRLPITDGPLACHKRLKGKVVPIAYDMAANFIFMGCMNWRRGDRYDDDDRT